MGPPFSTITRTSTPPPPPLTNNNNSVSQLHQDQINDHSTKLDCRLYKSLFIQICFHLINTPTQPPPLLTLSSQLTLSLSLLLNYLSLNSSHPCLTLSSSLSLTC